MGTIADYLLNKEQLKSNKTQNFFSNLMKTAEFGKSIYDTVQEQGKYKPGSDYYNFMKEQNVTWPQQNADYKLKLDKEYDETKAALDEAKANNDQERAIKLQDHLNELQAERDKYIQGQENYRAELAAGRSGRDQEQRLTASIKNALDTLTTLRPDWTTTDAAGRSVLDVDGHREEIKKAVLGYFSDPNDRSWVQTQLDNTLASYQSGGMPENKGSPAATIPAGPAQVQWLAKKYGDLSQIAQSVLPRSGKGFIPAETTMENEIRALLPSVTDQQDAETLQQILTESAAPGVLGGRNDPQDMMYRTYRAVVDKLKQKYGNVVRTRPPGVSDLK